MREESDEFYGFHRTINRSMLAFHSQKASSTFCGFSSTRLIANPSVATKIPSVPRVIGLRSDQAEDLTIGVPKSNLSLLHEQAETLDGSG
jgi:hypothetical protein